jgi:hypothetical protein
MSPIIQNLPIVWIPLLLLFSKYFVTGEFECTAMTKSSTVIHPEEVENIITSPHIVHCIEKCKELTSPSTCNIIEFNKAAATCLLAHKNIVQDICPVSHEKRKRSVESSDDLSVIDTFSEQFILKELITTGS